MRCSAARARRQGSDVSPRNPRPAVDVSSVERPNPVLRVSGPTPSELRAGLGRVRGVNQAQVVRALAPLGTGVETVANKHTYPGRPGPFALARKRVANHFCPNLLENSSCQFAIRPHIHVIIYERAMD